MAICFCDRVSCRARRAPSASLSDVDQEERSCARVWLARKGDRDMSSVRNSPVVVLGEFDGGHVGHRILIETARSIADDIQRSLVAVVLDDPSHAPRLSNVGDRCQWVLDQGATATLAILAAEGVKTVEPIAERIVLDLRPSCVLLACTPSDQAASERSQLGAAFRRFGVDVGEVPRAISSDGEPVTSSKVRVALTAGDLGSVHSLLGRPYSITGTVARGNQLGRTIGFPTANVVLRDERVLPPLGVYAGVVSLEDGREFTAAMNLGVRPTVVSDGELVLEAHLIDFDENLYGAEIEISLYERLRDEVKFQSLDELTQQLSRDVADARAAMGRRGF